MSFALVAGAVCQVHFSAGPVRISTVITLNINSTGAKNVKLHWASIDTDSEYSTLSSYSMKLGMFPPTKSLYIYDGSAYNVTIGSAVYGDYSD